MLDLSVALVFSALGLAITFTPRGLLTRRRRPVAFLIAEDAASGNVSTRDGSA